MATQVLPPEQGARPKTRDFWTNNPRGRSTVEPNRNPWRRPSGPPPRHHVIVPLPDTALPNDPETLPSHVRRQLDRERRGRQWTSKLGRELGRINRLLGAIENAQLIWDLAHGPIPDMWAYEIRNARCCDGPWRRPPDYDSQYYWFAWNSLDCLHRQLDGQGYGNGQFIFEGEMETPGTTFLIPGELPEQFMIGWTRTGGPRWAEHSSYVKVRDDNEGVQVTTKVVPSPWPGLSPAIDPNIERWMPPALQPEVQPFPVFQPSTAPALDPALEELAAAEPNATAQRAILAVPRVWARSWTSTRPDPKPEVVRPTEPPPENVKERKVVSRAARIGVMLYHILDQISEGADVVGAVYDALPDDVKKRWDCNRRSPADNFGQYGIGNADCKLNALWHNWHRLDVGQAVWNIVKNELEDKVYGEIHRRLPPQAGGPAMDDAWKRFGKVMEQLGF